VSAYRCFEAKNCQIVSVALIAVDGGGMLPSRLVTLFSADNG
jgi:hypothetical protein